MFFITIQYVGLEKLSNGDRGSKALDVQKDGRMTHSPNGRPALLETTADTQNFIFLFKYCYLYFFVTFSIVCHEDRFLSFNSPFMPTVGTTSFRTDFLLCRFSTV